MSTTHLTIAGALIIGIIGGCTFGGSGDGDSAETASDEAGDSGEATSSSGRSGGSSGSNRDQRLVGNWRYTETFADAATGFSMAYDQFMTIHANGTMEVRDGNMAGGNGDFGYSDPGAQESMQCEWRTRGNIIEIKGEGRDWTPLAEYEVSAESLLTVSSGERQLWNRI